MLTGFKVVVDVQHLYREGPHAGDRGAVFALRGGGTVTEGECAIHYAQAAVSALRDRGATVHTNNVSAHVLVGPYSRRQSQAMVMGADLYLACHVNAGGGAYAAVEYLDRPECSDVAKAVLSELKGSIPELVLTRTTVLAPGARGAVCLQGFTSGPAVLLEPFFGDWAGHRRLVGLSGLAEVGAAIARGCGAWWAQRRPVAA
jgi:N-acetylmuramoyl-L-alanine amidase